MDSETQFWWNCGVQAVVAFFTLTAVLVALFGRWFQHALAPPRLSVELVNPLGTRVPISIASNIPVPTVRHTFARYYHLRVMNKRRWTLATQTQLFLISVEEPDAAGQDVLTWAGLVPMRWQHSDHTGAGPRTLAYSAEVDLCAIVQSTDSHTGKWVELCPAFVPNELKVRRDGPFTLKATFLARSYEADSDLLHVKIAWDGQWSDDSKEMAKHLVVKTLPQLF